MTAAEEEFRVALAEWDEAKDEERAAYLAWKSDGYEDAAGVWYVNSNVEKDERLQRAHERVRAAEKRCTEACRSFPTR